MNLLAKIKENKARLSQLETIAFRVLGVDGNADNSADSTTFIICGKNDTRPVAVPTNMFTHSSNDGEILINGKWAVDNIFGMIEVNKILK